MFRLVDSWNSGYDYWKMRRGSCCSGYVENLLVLVDCLRVLFDYNRAFMDLIGSYMGYLNIVRR